jgi:multiple sugar transport system substrate-binding protein
MRPRPFAKLAAAVAAASMLTACGIGGSGGSDAQPSSEVTGKVTGEVSLQTWALKPNYTDYVQGVIKAFETKYPGVHVKWLDQPGDGYDTKVLSQASSGTLPDVSNLPPDFAAPLAQQGMLVDIAKADPSATGDYVPGGLTAYQYPGLDGTYGYPWYLGTDINYWNTKALASYGITKDQLPTDLDSLIAAAKIVTQKSGGKKFLMTRKPGLNDFVSAGIPIFSPDGTSFAFNTPEAAALVQKYADAFKQGLLPDDVLTSSFEGNATLYNEEKGLWTTGGGNISGLQDANPGLVPNTTFTPALGQTPPLYVQGLSVSSKSKNMPAAIALARFVTSPENQKAFAKKAVGVFPSTTASADDPFFSKSDGTPAREAMVTAFDELKNAKPNPATFTSAMGTILDQQIALAISGKTTPQKALDTAVEKCNQLLAQGQ